MSATTRYEVCGWQKDAEVDSFEHGCQLEGGTSCTGSDRFAAATVQLLVTKLREFVPFETDSDSVELDSCDEPGRIDISGMETDDGNEPTAGQIERWKAGQFTLYYVTYSFHVERVTRETVSLTRLKDGTL